jgi:hypothetical protein
VATGRSIKMPTTVKHMFQGQKVEGKVLNRFWFGSGIVDAKESAKPRTLKAAEQQNAPAVGGGTSTTPAATPSSSTANPPSAAATSGCPA